MSPIVREVTIGPCRLIQGDCAEVLPLIGRVDAVVTDPPYGIGEDGGAQRTRGSKRLNGEKMGWDSQRPSNEIFALMRVVSFRQIIWGGNYFADLLPVSRGWLYWNKLIGGDFSDGELAWTNIDMVLKSFTKRKTSDEMEHTTQKPLALMKWCLGFLPDAKTILDPFMGSGTTGVACIRTGRQFIGIEKEPKYFDISVKRIQQAWDLKCSELPFEAIEQPKQAKLFEVEGAK